MSIVHIPFYPSDWLAGTRGMSDAETGVYITLVARMYEMAGPIERDDERLFRLCGCKSKASFVKSLNYLLSEGKVIELAGGLYNERVQKELTNTIAKSDKAKAAAQSRWKRKDNKNRAGTAANASAKHMLHQCQPIPKPDLRGKDTNVSLSVDTDAPHPANDISHAFSRYNEAAKEAGWPQVQKMTPKRSKLLRARLNECDGLIGWEEALRRALASDFCRGRTTRPWPGFSFDWLTNAANFTKLIEGNYDNRSDNTHRTPNTSVFGPGTSLARIVAEREIERRKTT